MATTTTSAGAARQTAADLFAAAGRRLDLPAVARLECLAAEQALQTTGRALTPPAAALPSEDLIHAALRTLGELPFEQFRDRRVLEAARHGRQALREQ